MRETGGGVRETGGGVRETGGGVRETGGGVRETGGGVSEGEREGLTLKKRSVLPELLSPNKHTYFPLLLLLPHTSHSNTEYNTHSQIGVWNYVFVLKRPNMGPLLTEKGQ